MSRNIWYLITVLWAIIFGLSVIYSIPDPSWSQQTVAEDIDQRFFDLELAGSEVNIVYRNSSDSGVMLKSMNAESTVLDSVKNRLTGSSWKQSDVIDDSSGSGSYLSAEEINGELAVAYQDASIGSERVVFAEGENWSKQTVEDVEEGGVNVGMYTSLTSYRSNPLILYHSPTQGLKSASGNDNWKKNSLNESMGWFTDTASCGEKAFAAYRGRESNELRVSTFEGSWITEKTNSSVKSSLSIDQKNCQLHTAYLNEENEVIYRTPEGREEVLTRSDYSDISIDMSQGIRVSYYNYGEGMFYAEKHGEDWEKTQLTNSSSMSRYNDLAVDEAGNIHLVFVRDSDLVHAEKNSGRIQNLNMVLHYLRISAGAILALLIIQSLRKTGVLNRREINPKVEDYVQ
jgi:hypothetical protein